MSKSHITMHQQWILIRMTSCEGRAPVWTQLTQRSYETGWGLVELTTFTVSWCLGHTPLVSTLNNALIIRYNTSDNTSGKFLAIRNFNFLEHFIVKYYGEINACKLKIDSYFICSVLGVIWARILHKIICINPHQHMTLYRIEDRKFFLRFVKLYCVMRCGVKTVLRKIISKQTF